MVSGCAQRLSASTNCSLGRSGRQLVGLPGAQRLSASTNCSRGCRIANVARSTGAQRLSASTNCSPNAGCFLRRGIARCSTPFGINELFTGTRRRVQGRLESAQRLSASTNCSPVWRSRGNAGGDVLNAFRHQRTVHNTITTVAKFKSIQCSTPFGINELFTNNADGVPYPLVSAQRLSASTNCSPDD